MITYNDLPVLVEEHGIIVSDPHLIRLLNDMVDGGRTLGQAAYTLLDLTWLSDWKRDECPYYGQGVRRSQTLEERGRNPIAAAMAEILRQREEAVWAEVFGPAHPAYDGQR